jgi:hypothetical protein
MNPQETRLTLGRDDGFRHVNENKEIEKNTKRDAEGQKSNTGATQKRKSNNVEICEKKKRKKEEVTQGSLILASSSCDVSCQEEEQEEGEEYELGENSRRADEQGATFRGKGKELRARKDTDAVEFDPRAYLALDPRRSRLGLPLPLPFRHACVLSSSCTSSS